MSLKHRLISALALTICTAMPALAYTNYQGGGFYTDFSEVCGGISWQGTNRPYIRFRPAGAPDNNATRSNLSFFSGHESVSFTFENPSGQFPVAGQWLAVTTTSISASGYQPGGVQLRFLETTPFESINGGATTFFFAFEVMNFDGVEGCTIRGRGVVGLQ
jgi:hypothetical protein